MMVFVKVIVIYLLMFTRRATDFYGELTAEPISFRICATDSL